MNLGQLIVELALDASAFNRSLEKTKNSAVKAVSEIEDTFLSLGNSVDFISKKSENNLKKISQGLRNIRGEVKALTDGLGNINLTRDFTSFNYANYAEGGIVTALGREKRASGKTPVLAALTLGERVLTVEENKQLEKLSGNIFNYSQGGIVGGKQESWWEKIKNTGKSFWNWVQDISSNFLGNLRNFWDSFWIRFKLLAKDFGVASWGNQPIQPTQPSQITQNTSNITQNKPRKSKKNTSSKMQNNPTKPSKNRQNTSSKTRQNKPKKPKRQLATPEPVVFRLPGRTQRKISELVYYLRRREAEKNERERRRNEQEKQKQQAALRRKELKQARDLKEEEFNRDRESLDFLKKNNQINSLDLELLRLSDKYDPLNQNNLKIPKLEFMNAEADRKIKFTQDMNTLNEKLYKREISLVGFQGIQKYLKEITEKQKKLNEYTLKYGEIMADIDMQQRNIEKSDFKNSSFTKLVQIQNEAFVIQNPIGLQRLHFESVLIW